MPWSVRLPRGGGSNGLAKWRLHRGAILTTVIGVMLFGQSESTSIDVSGGTGGNGGSSGHHPSMGRMMRKEAEAEDEKKGPQGALWSVKNHLPRTDSRAGASIAEKLAPGWAAATAAKQEPSGAPAASVAEKGTGVAAAATPEKAPAAPQVQATLAAATEKLTVYSGGETACASELREHGCRCFTKDPGWDVCDMYPCVDCTLKLFKDGLSGIPEDTRFLKLGGNEIEDFQFAELQHLTKLQGLGVGNSKFSTTTHSGFEHLFQNLVRTS